MRRHPQSRELEFLLELFYVHGYEYTVCTHITAHINSKIFYLIYSIQPHTDTRFVKNVCKFQSS
jgi:hypothetical protein